VSEGTFERFVSGKLGISVNNYQRTIKQKADGTPWRRIGVAVSGGELLFSFSFDGETYSDERVMVDGDVEIIKEVVRGVRVRVPRRKKYDSVTYNILCVVE